MKKYYGLVLCICCLFFIAKPSQTQAQNMLLNSSFEIWFDSMGIRMPFAWYTSEANDSGSATRTTDMHTGIYALKLTGGDTLAYAMTLSLCTAGNNYYFSGWTKSTSFIAGSFVITWLKLSQQPLMDPVIIPILRNTSYHNYTQMVQAPDSAVLVNVDVVALPGITIYVDDITLSDTVLTGIEEKHYPQTADRQSLNIFPNPTKSVVNISCPSSINQIELFDVTGKIIQKINHPRTNMLTLDVRNFKDGVYFLSMHNNHNRSVEKFIIQK
jgi:hypothetical protein